LEVSRPPEEIHTHIHRPQTAAGLAHHRERGVGSVMTAYGGGAIELRFQRKRMTFFIWNENRWWLLNNYYFFLFICSILWLFSLKMFQ